MKQIDKYHTDGSRRQFIKRMGSGGVSVGFAALLTNHEISLPSWPPSHDVTDEEYWALVRAQYPLTHARGYMNTGGLGPAPYPVLDALQRTQLELQRISEHGHKQLVAAREPVASFFGVKPSEVAFMRNATEANATIASGLTFLKAGDEVIFESHAHPGGAIPWMNRQKQEGIRVRVFEPDPESVEGNLERIADLITPRTRVIQVSHMTAPTGIKMPVAQIAALAKDREVWFHIDGAQSAGAFPFNLKEIGCDSYGTSGHKWMGAPHGTGMLYVREERLDEVNPTEVGAYSDNGMFTIPDQFEYNATAQRFEPGTRDASRVVAMTAAIRFLEEIGMERVAAYGQGLAVYLQDQLRPMAGVTVLTPRDPALSAGLTTFKLDAMGYRELYQLLSTEFKLRCRIVTEQGLDAIRVSTHIFNNTSECDRVVEGVQAAIG